jgi:hypothetical protein
MSNQPQTNTQTESDFNNPIYNLIKKNWLFLSAVFILLGFGLSHIELPGLHFDEVLHPSYATRILNPNAQNLPHFSVPGENPLSQNGLYPITGGSIYNVTIVTYALIPYFYIFGSTPATLRIFELSVALLILIFFYRAVKIVFDDEKIAGISSILLASCPTFIFAFRYNIWLNLLPLLFFFPAITILSKRFLQESKSSNWRLWWAGILLGISSMAYFTGYYLSTAALLFFFILIFRESNRWKKILTLSFGFLLGISPQIISFLSIMHETKNEISFIPKRQQTGVISHTTSILDFISNQIGYEFMTFWRTLNFTHITKRLVEMQPLGIANASGILFLVGAIITVFVGISRQKKKKIDFYVILFSILVLFIYFIGFFPFSKGVSEGHVMPIFPFLLILFSMFSLFTISNKRSKFLIYFFSFLKIGLFLVLIGINISCDFYLIKNLIANGGTTRSSIVNNQIAGFLDGTAAHKTVHFIGWGLHLQTLLITEGRVQYKYDESDDMTLEKFKKIIQEEKPVVFVFNYLINPHAMSDSASEKLHHKISKFSSEFTPSQNITFYNRDGSLAASILTYNEKNNYKIEEILKFKGNENSKYLNGDWNQPEDAGVWSSGNNANVLLLSDWTQGKNYLLELGVSAALFDKKTTQKIQIFANQQMIGEHEFSTPNNHADLRFSLPKNMFPSQPLRITIVTGEIRKPCDVSDSKDQRELGVLLRNLRVTEKIPSSEKLKIQIPNVKKLEQTIGIEYKIGTLLNSWKNELINPCLTAGWHEPEEHGVWSNAKSSTIFLKNNENQFKGKKISITFSLTPLLTNKVPIQKLKIFINGKLFTSWDFKKGGVFPELKILCFYEELFKNGEAEIRLDVENPIIPSKDGDGNDDRLLGIMLHSLNIAQEPQIKK